MYQRGCSATANVKANSGPGSLGRVDTGATWAPRLKDGAWKCATLVPSLQASGLCYETW